MFLLKQKEGTHHLLALLPSPPSPPLLSAPCRPPGPWIQPQIQSLPRFSETGDFGAQREGLAAAMSRRRGLTPSPPTRSGCASFHRLPPVYGGTNISLQSLPTLDRPSPSERRWGIYGTGLRYGWYGTAAVDGAAARPSMVAPGTGIPGGTLPQFAAFRSADAGIDLPVISRHADAWRAVAAFAFIRSLR